MKNTLDTMLAPGAVLMSCKAGRMVLAVVCTAPETRPSASFCAIIIVPRTTVSCSCLRASSGVKPLDLRNSHMGATYCSTSSAGLRISSDSGRLTPKSLATASTSWRVASSTQRARPFSWQMAAACTVRGSAPSGRTMRLPALRAASIMLKRNWAGERRTLCGAARAAVFCGFSMLPRKASPAEAATSSGAPMMPPNSTARPANEALAICTRPAVAWPLLTANTTRALNAPASSLFWRLKNRYSSLGVMPRITRFCLPSAAARPMSRSNQSSALPAAASSAPSAAYCAASNTAASGSCAAMLAATAAVSACGQTGKMKMLAIFLFLSMDCLAVAKRFRPSRNLFGVSAWLPPMHLGRIATLQNLAIVPLLPAFRALPCGQSASADTSRRDTKQVL